MLQQVYTFLQQILSSPGLPGQTVVKSLKVCKLPDRFLMLISVALPLLHLSTHDPIAVGSLLRFKIDHAIAVDHLPKIALAEFPGIRDIRLNYSAAEQ
ncbi:hypothetical protein D3C73_1508230 [compost metagenome]